MGKKTTPTYRRSGIYGTPDVLEKEGLWIYCKAYRHSVFTVGSHSSPMNGVTDLNSYAVKHFDDAMVCVNVVVGVLGDQKSIDLDYFG